MNGATVMGARGLYTSPSQTAGAPEGSAVLAENMVVPRPGVYESRRGYSFLGDTFPSGTITSITEFKGVLIGHGGGILARFDVDSAQWVPYGYVAPTLGAVSHTVDTGYTNILPVVALTGSVAVGNGTITIVTQVAEDGTNTFTWASTAFAQNETPTPFEPAGTTELVTDEGVGTGISVTWGDETYGPGDTYTFTVSGGAPGTTYLPPNGPIKNPDGSLAAGRVRFHETGNCLYFTTSKGVFRLGDPFDKPYLAGISEGLLGTAALTGSSGFLADGFSVAYRETWSVRTPDGRLIEGAPSGRVTVFNTVGGGSSRNVTRTIPIPKDLPPGAFLRVWRTSSFPNSAGPDENFAQVHEKALADMPATGPGTYTFTDITPDAIRGDAAYFSVNLGDGLLSAKYRPPLATDILTFRDSTVYFGATGLHNVQMTLLSVAPFQGTNDDGIVFVFPDGYREDYRSTFSNPPVVSSDFTVFTSGTPSQNIANTSASLIRQINNRPGGRLRAIYLSSDTGTPGSIRVEARTLDQPQFIVRGLYTTLPWSPTLKVESTAILESRAANQVRVSNAAPHGLAVGQQITITSSSQPTVYPIGSKTVSSVIDALTFTYTDIGPNGTVSAVADFTTQTVDITSEQPGGPDFIAWSPLGEPDAVPVLNYVRVGKTENPVLPGLVLGNSLYLRKADGLYRLSGDTPNTFGLDQVDTTVSFIAPYAGFTLGGNAYSLTTEGLKMWTESGRPQPASVPVESAIRDLTVQAPEQVNRHAFAVNYESERTMLLWLPSGPDSTSANFAYRYNYLTQAWTTETTPATCAVVSPTQDRLYIGKPEAGRVVVERKDRKATDFVEPDGTGVPASLIYSPQLGSDPSLGKNFNRMKYHMDPDSPMPTTLGVNFRTDWVPEPTAFTIPGEYARGPTFETLVDGQHKRGTRLYVGVTHNVPGEKLAILGYSVTFYEHTLGAA